MKFNEKERRRTMKARFLMLLPVTLFAALAMPVGLAAQEKKDPMHHHYKLVDLGTLGGAQSTVTVGRPLNNQGTVVGCADTSTSDPNYPNFNPFLSPFGADPFIFHTFEFEKGIVTDVGALPGVNSSCESFLTDGGLIVGGSENGLIDPLTGWPAMEAVAWHDGQVTNLGTFGGNESFAIWANNHSQIVGAAANTIADPFSVFFGWGTQTRAFLWENGSKQDLGTLGGPDALAITISDRGHVFGASYTSYTPNPITGIPPYDGFLWKRGKGMMDIPNGFGGTQVNPYFANNRDQMVGNASFADEATFHPFLWSDGNFIDLGTFGGTQGEGAWINEAGAVTGQAGTPGNSAVHGFLWRKGVLTDLGTVDGDACSGGLSINSANQIVGVSFACDQSVAHGFLWEEGQIVDLNTLVSAGSDIQLQLSYDINDKGQIAGFGASANGDSHAFLLIPCDDDHPGIDGCDYSLVDASDLVSRPNPVGGAASRTLSQTLMSRMNRYRFAGLAARPRN
jgi:probable HAF family extracellular repeat protein